MKNFKIVSTKIGLKTMFAGLLLLGSSAAFAQQSQEGTQLGVGLYHVKNGDKFCLTVEKLPKKSASVQLLTESGIELYGGSLPRNSTKFSQKFDLTDLESGKYILRIRQGQEVISKSLELERTSVNEKLLDRTVSLVN